MVFRGPASLAVFFYTSPVHHQMSSHHCRLMILELQSHYATAFRDSSSALYTGTAAPGYRHKLYLSCLVSFRDIVHVCRLKTPYPRKETRPPCCRVDRARARSPQAEVPVLTGSGSSSDPEHAGNAFVPHNMLPQPHNLPLTVAAPCTRCPGGTGACRHPWPSAPPCG